MDTNFDNFLSVLEFGMNCQCEKWTVNVNFCFVRDETFDVLVFYLRIQAQIISQLPFVVLHIYTVLADDKMSKSITKYMMKIQDILKATESKQDYNFTLRCIFYAGFKICQCVL